jgi:O-acetyl-ADP-ribose deacetylase (regulator of RNase III)
VIDVRTGDLFASGAQTLVNTVNCVGVMGKGVALQFKERFPDMYADYVARCKAGEVKLGKPYVFRRQMGPWVLNFPTKDHWRAVSRLSDIEAGLAHLEEHYREWGITSLAVPPLGCGHGQLEWRVVGPTLYRHLRRLDIPVTLFAPHGSASDELTPDFLGGTTSPAVAPAPRVPAAAIALVAVLERISREPYHWPIGRIFFQKLAYFATEAGIPTGLAFARGSFGPFAAGLKQLTSRLVNNGLVIEESVGRMISVRPGPTHAEAIHRYRADLAPFEAAIDRVADLCVRMDAKQAEVAATVHFVAKELTHEGAALPTETAILEEAMRWKQRRDPPLSETDMADAIRSLNVLGWLRATSSASLPVTEETGIRS